MTAIKLCGLSTPAAVAAAARLGADYIGFVFFARSPRNVTPEQAGALGAPVAGRVGRVGVFVDPDDALLDAAAAALDAFQLHGGETPARVAAVRARYGKPVWRAEAVASRAEMLAAVARWRGAADLLLLDAKPPADAALPGGNGVALDWRIVADVRPGMPWGLAGGLTSETVADAIAATATPLVDASSGLEDAPGMKSVAKMTAFVEAVRGR